MSKYYLCTLIGFALIALPCLGQPETNLKNETKNLIVYPEKSRVVKKVSFTRIDGKALKCFLIAYEDFKKSKQELGNFKVFFEKKEDNMEVCFMVKEVPGKKRDLGGRTSLGYDINYRISMDKYIIIKKYYSR